MSEKITFEIKVVAPKGEKLFRHNEGKKSVLFNQLSAYHEFEWGTLTVIRDDALIKEGRVYMSGQHMTFTGLGAANHSTTAISANDYRIGDNLNLTIPDDRLDVPFADFMQTQFQLAKATMDAFSGDGQNGLSLDELQAKVASNLKQQKKEPQPEVLRF